MKPLRDTWLTFERSMWMTLRNPVWIVVGLIQPVLYLVLFGPFLKSIAENTPSFPPGGAFNIFVPGLLIQLALFGTAYGGFGLLSEMRSGVVERMRVTPISRFAMLFGRALRDVVVLDMGAILLILIAVPFGLTIDLAGLFVAMALLSLIGLTMAPISYTLALLLKSEDALAPLITTITLPLLLLSGILLPLTLAPDWLQTLAKINPLSHAVDAIRALFNGHFGDPSVGFGVALMTVLAFLALFLASRTFSRANA